MAVLDTEIDLVHPRGGKRQQLCVSVDAAVLEMLRSDLVPGRRTEGLGRLVSGIIREHYARLDEREILKARVAAAIGGG